MKNTSGNDKGFTLAELLMAILILAIALTGLLQIFIRSSMLTEITRNKTAAMSEASGKMEEIRGSVFESIETNYDGTVFALTQLTGWGFIEVTSVQAGELLEVEIAIGWEDKYNRIIGEDADLNGNFVVGSEDTDGNGRMSSIVTLVSMLADRTD